MEIRRLKVNNFKSIDKICVEEIDNAFILVGKNNTGKSSVIDAIRAVLGEYNILIEHFNNSSKDVIVEMTLEDKNGNLKNIKYTVTPDGEKEYDDGEYRGKVKPSYLPRLYYIDHKRDLSEFQQGLLSVHGDESLTALKNSNCIFDNDKKCNQCFDCIEEINKKTPEKLNIYETALLMGYKLYKMNMDSFAKSVNKYMEHNGLQFHKVRYELGINIDNFINISTIINNKRNTEGGLNTLSSGSKSIYLLSLIEAYIEEKQQNSSIIMIEDPEIFLHSQMQKSASEILYRLSKKNQVVFSTYSPNMIFNFSSKQIKQVILDEDYYTQVMENVDIDVILDDLGYSAMDLMNVNFVFIVEGKQDSNRLPMLLEKYYSEMRDEDDKLKRITIVITNSCTNIKTYANLKYINKLHLKDQFLMIRDSDGKNPNYLVKQLCSHYKQKAKKELESIPNVTPKNVLVLKYYSFENYFLDPEVMVKIGVIRSEDEFYTTLYHKFKDYLYKIPCVKRMIRTKNVRINNKEDVKKHMEQIKTYVRGHNLFDIFYGKYKSEENDILRRYIEVAPRENFRDILDAIDAFVYFENRKIKES